MSNETYVIHVVDILDQMDDEHFAIADLSLSNSIGRVNDEEDSPLTAVVLLLDLVRKLDGDHVLVLRRKEEESND
jgi:hypothetical protein